MDTNLLCDYWKVICYKVPDPLPSWAMDSQQITHKGVPFYEVVIDGWDQQFHADCLNWGYGEVADLEVVLERMGFERANVSPHFDDEEISFEVDYAAV